MIMQEMIEVYDEYPNDSFKFIYFTADLRIYNKARALDQGGRPVHVYKYNNDYTKSYRGLWCLQ